MVKFNDPAYQEWATWTYNSPILPKHIWEAKANEDILKDTNENGVGTGPYMYKTHADDRMVWVKNDDWWAKTALNLDVKPKYIVDIVNGANSVALGMVLQGGLDLSQQLPAGRRRARRSRLRHRPTTRQRRTCSRPTRPGSSRTTRRRRSTTRQFRKAIATAINIGRTSSTRRTRNIVAPADPTGLLPSWDKYVDHGRGRPARLQVRH